MQFALRIAAVAPVIAAAGCAEKHPLPYPPSVIECPAATKAAAALAIDTGLGPKLLAGTGDSVAIEYSDGGHWHFQATCDTPTTGYVCAFNVTAQVLGGTVSNVLGEALEPDDDVGSPCPDTASMSLVTEGDVDGMLFDTAPGATVQVTVSLDDALQRGAFEYVVGGELQVGAPADPVDFTPQAP